MTARVLLVDDHEVVRVGLRTLLSHHPLLEVVAEAACADDAVALVDKLRPEIVLLDIRMRGGSGIDACARIVRQHPSTRVIMLSSYSDQGLLGDAIAAGAAGYVLKQIGSGQLIAAMEAVARGEVWLDPSLLKHVFARVRHSVEREHQDAFSALTAQEVRILGLVTKGRHNKEIGRELGLTEKTVRNYVSSILSKLELQSRAEASAYAVKHHLDDLVELLVAPADDPS